MDIALVRNMLIECEVCGDDLEEGEYTYKGKSVCDDCYRAVRKLEAVKQKGSKPILQNQPPFIPILIA